MAKIICSNNAPAPIGPYSQAVLVPVTDSILYCSGQIPLDPATGNILGNTIEEQTEMVIKNISAILKEAGLDFSSVIKTTCFLKSMDDFTVFNGIYEKYFISKPARSCVEVSRLPKDVLVEVEVIAAKKNS